MATQKIVVALSLLLVATVASAHYGDIRFRHITTNDGLSHHSINCFLQDQKGFIWIGTQDGLNKYDGYTFKKYYHDELDASSICGNWIHTLCETKAGLGSEKRAIWIGTNGGASKFDPVTETFTSYKHDPAQEHSLSHNLVYEITEDKNGELWFGTEDGLNRFNSETGSFIRYKHDPDRPQSIIHSTVNVIFEDRSGTLWLGTEGGLDKFDRETDSFIHYRHVPKDLHSLSHNRIIAICEEPEGLSNDLWIGTWGGGLNKFNKESGSFEHIGKISPSRSDMGKKRIASLFMDSNQTLWVGSESDGLWQLEHRTKGKYDFTIHKRHPMNPQGLSHNLVLSIFEDRTGNLWVGTDNNINVYARSYSVFQHYYYSPDNADGMNDYTVRAICEYDDDTILLGTLYGGLNILNRETGHFDHVTKPFVDQEIKQPYSISAIFCTSDGQLWIGTWGGGLRRFDRLGGKQKIYQHQPTDPQSPPHNQVQAILQDSNGRLWIGTEGGLSRWRPETETFVNYISKPDNPNGLSDNRLQSNALYEDPYGNLWIGTYVGGLNRLNLAGIDAVAPEQAVFSHFSREEGKRNTINNNAVIAIHGQVVGDSLTLWLGTFGGGLNKIVFPVVTTPSGDQQLSETRYRITHYTTNQGLPNDVIYAILEDDERNLWLSTNHGLSRFDPGTEEFRNYDVNDGLQANTFFWGASHKSKSGELFFGGTNGFNAFFPARLHKNTVPPPVVLTDFRLLNQPVGVAVADSRDTAQKFTLPKHISYLDQVTLSYEAIHFSLGFAALDFTSPTKNHYAYKMTGLHDKWVDLGNRHEVSFTNLPPGKYTFNVSASNNDGVWNETGASLRVLITPPAWKTWWFRLIILSGIGVSLLTAHKIRTKSIEARNRELQREISERREAEGAQRKSGEQLRALAAHLQSVREEERTAIAREMHDELGQVLTAFKMDLAFLRREIDGGGKQLEPSVLLNEIDSMRHLIDKTIDKIRTLIRQLRPEVLDSLGLVAAIAWQAEEFSIRTGINADFQSDIEQLELDRDVSTAIFRIFQESLTNIARHSQATRFDVNLTKVNGTLLLRIADNGVGLSREALNHPQTFGLIGMKERAIILGGDVDVQGISGKGTTVTVSVPIKQISTPATPHS